ncbi:LOW QUALITY PROTEIN: E3 ubiquitin-protein ligase listerin [Durio zibethinus]|uniref:E3 ubiquitin-protein ligase listerin n=1 Tax=Durio zibethinus TaxID=66656 RepID=A0A6P5XQK0_DURZI|nr:LOW QUALITY PROTEIN: E3 ubiquitin-protein ligase listerin [Durio zibethinus]
MGRQKGDGARSKARPSSSSLAASLLPSSSAAAAVGFGGYVGSSRLDSSLSTEDSTPFLDIDSEVAQHLKRLARKDPTTKLKALASLSALLKQKSGKEIVPIIPQWAFEYKKLLLDYNREVRRATHDTMTNLVTAVRRDLAPHLKSLMGPWWFSQFDPSSEVSQAAKRSLQAAFPAPEKRLDALILCTTEIFIYLEENLKLTPQNLSDKAVALDELQEMHQQVVSSSLLALATLLDVLVSVQIESPGFENVAAEPKHASKAKATAISFAEKLFSDHKYFLEFLKSQSPAVRSATYSVLRSFIKNIPQAFGEGNMKTLATAVLGAFLEKDPTCHSSMWDAILLFSKRFPDSWTTLNVQKSVFNRFWSFIRNGCFGSQQVSYPALVLFLDAIPSKVFSGDNFFLDFFDNLWAGRNPIHSPNADQLAFFGAFKECFLWGLHNASRFCDSVDSVSHFRITLINNILVKLLWQDYLSSVGSKDQDSDQALHGKTTETQNIKYSISYLQELGKCIVEILSGIYALEHDLLFVFCMAFQETCERLLQQKVITEQPAVNIDLIIKFLFLVDRHAKQKGEAWPLLHLVGPMLAKSFPLVRSLDSPDGVRLLSISVSIFGARKVLKEIFSNSNALSCGPPHDKDSELKLEYFLQAYKETFVPWCLHEHDCGTSARLDLLLALLDNECFSEQWHAVITYAIDLVNSKVGSRSINSNHLAVLAMLFEKVRNEIRRRKVEENSFHRLGSLPDHWHHDLLEATAVSVAFSLPPFGTSDARFVCSVLGGATEGNLDSLVSRKSMILIVKEVLRRLVSFILDSSFNSVKQAGALFTSVENGLGLESKNPANVVDLAHFALEIFEGSFFCLRALDEESGLVSSISSAVFIIDWEYRMTLAVDDALNDESCNKIKARLGICESAHGCQSKISNLWKSFSTDVRKGIRSIFICTIRSAIFKEDKLDTNKFMSLCYLMMIDVLECLCQDQYEEQNLLDHLLSKGDMWPWWIVADFHSLKGSAKSDTERVAYGNYKFISLIDKLIYKLGFDKVIACEDLDTSPLSTEDKTNTEVTSRAWLAAEILCTWKWPEGSAATSFLPQLISFAKSRNYSSHGSFLDSIFSILLDGALIHGENCVQTSLHAWPTLGEDMEDIQEPFLRALVSFLFTLLKENIWGTGKAMILFQLLVNKLFIGEAVNTNCLRILPPILCVLVPTLWQRSIRSSECTSTDVKPDALDENRMQDTIKSWLQRILLFPPLVTWQTGQDMEEWFHLVFSCYPLRVMGGAEIMKLDRSIGHEERILLLDLFRKQRHENSGSIAANQLPVVQMLLSKLMVISVGYCWREFDEEDWEFLFFHLRYWIESAVVMMEEVAENVNDAVTEHSSSDSLDLICDKLKQIVLVSDPSPINVTKNSIISFSFFCGLLELQPTKDTDNLNPLRTERWDPIRNQILESILRLFFSTGIAEAITGSYSNEAASIISASRFYHRSFWELVASSVIKSPPHTREEAVKSVELWGLSKGPICSLYAILFSSRPIPSLQLAAYAVLSTEPVSKLAVFGEGSARCLDVDSNAYQESNQLDLSAEENIHLREELSYMIEKLPHDVLDMDLVAEQRVHLFLAWSLFLSHLSSLPSLSSSRERLVQYIQNSANPLILDCLFQHLPSDLSLMHVLKKKDGELPNVLSEAATAATRSITTGSLFFSVESLWPIEPVKMAALAGAIYGFMLRLLPAYVRGWFSDLRDRSTSSLIESFTRTWCSPPLVANELSLIKTANFADENFSVSVSKSANEVVATYTKDETGMDLIIRLPASYPLRSVDVDCMRSLGISEVKQRKWLMSMMSFVRSQNGALAEAIRIWKRNFDKEFEGVEECPICYSVIHTVNHSLPRLACKTCKHKFHSACLYKWFSTSHKSSCPLCQSPF